MEVRRRMAAGAVAGAVVGLADERHLLGVLVLRSSMGRMAVSMGSSRWRGEFLDVETVGHSKDKRCWGRVGRIVGLGLHGGSGGLGDLGAEGVGGEEQEEKDGWNGGVGWVAGEEVRGGCTEEEDGEAGVGPFDQFGGAVEDEDDGAEELGGGEDFHEVERVAEGLVGLDGGLGSVGEELGDG